MEIRTFKTKLSFFRGENSLRNDFKYISTLEKQTTSYYSYKDIFEFIPYSSTDLEELGDFLYAEIGDVSKNGDVFPNKLNFEDRNDFNGSLFKKIEKGDIIKPLKGDILISKIRPYLNKVVLVGEDEVYFTKAFIHIRPKINAEILYFALRTVFHTQINAVSRQGKGYPTLKEEDIKTIRFEQSMIDAFITKEKEIAEKINALKNEITMLKNVKIKPPHLINQAFAEVYGIDTDFYKTFGKGMTAGTQQCDTPSKSIYKIPFSQIQKSNLVRISGRFHNPKTQFLTNTLFAKPTLKVKDVVAEMVKGVQPEYDTAGEVPVVKIANLKNGFVDMENPELVAQSFFDNLDEKRKIKRNDVLICCTGKISLGKIDIYETDNDAVLTVDNYIIRLKDGYNPLFFVYFFRSIFGSFQVERDFTGATNQIHLYDKQINEFDYPDFSLAYQNEIVTKIQTQIAAQNSIDTQIAAKQDEINRIIETVVKVA